MAISYALCHWNVHEDQVVINVLKLQCNTIHGVHHSF